MNATIDQRRCVARTLSRAGWMARYFWYDELDSKEAEKIINCTSPVELEDLAFYHDWKQVDPTLANEQLR